jgi:hypothetical protein
MTTINIFYHCNLCTRNNFVRCKFEQSACKTIIIINYGYSRIHSTFFILPKKKTFPSRWTCIIMIKWKLCDAFSKKIYRYVEQTSFKKNFFTFFLFFLPVKVWKKIMEIKFLFLNLPSTYKGSSFNHFYGRWVHKIEGRERKIYEKWAEKKIKFYQMRKRKKIILEQKANKIA